MSGEFTASGGPPLRFTVVLGVSGSIAAYKAVDVARLLLKSGARVVPMMTAAAQRFVGAATLGGICGEKPITSMWDAEGEPHVRLASLADVMALVPATAELLAALAQGRASDVVRAAALCSHAPIVAAPAMHPRMWRHPATQRNVTTLLSDGRVRLVGPVAGLVASGEKGLGRMAEPAAIVEAIRGAGATGGLGLAPPRRRDLTGQHLVVTAGPTVEDIDPARYLSNRSSGKMGYALATRASRRGARVTLISGPVALSAPAGVTLRRVRSARDLRQCLDQVLGADLQGADALIMAAAVADYRPVKQHHHKIKRNLDSMTLEMVKNEDILAGIGQRRHAKRPLLVGFALETVAGAALKQLARDKLARKRVDMVVANRAADAFDGDDNIAMLVTSQAAEPLPKMSKLALADRILDHLIGLLGVERNTEGDAHD